MVADSNIITLLGNRVIYDPGEMKLPSPPDPVPSDDSGEEDPHLVDLVSNGKEENIGGLRMIGRTTREHLTEMHPADKSFAVSLRESELSSLEKLNLINAHIMTALPTYESSEVITSHNVRKARDMRSGDCDDRARLAYAIAVEAGVEQKNLGLAIGGMDTNAPDSEDLDLGGHMVLVYFDEENKTLVAFEPDASEGIKLQTPDANSPNDVFTGVLNFRDGGNNSANYSLVIDYLYTNGQNIAVSREAAVPVTPPPEIKQPATPAALGTPQPR